MAMTKLLVSVFGCDWSQTDLLKFLCKFSYISLVVDYSDVCSFIGIYMLGPGRFFLCCMVCLQGRFYFAELPTDSVHVVSVVSLVCVWASCGLVFGWRAYS